MEKLSNIDLFFYGDLNLMMELFKLLLENLESNKIEYLIGIANSVVWIFIKGTIKIIQLIFTDKSSPDEIIDTFDLTHLQSYWTGTKLYCKNGLENYIYNNQTYSNYKPRPSRIIKYLRRNLNV